MDICAGNLSGNVIGSDVREVFESLGRLETADVVKHGHDHESRGLGYVGMPAGTGDAAMAEVWGPPTPPTGILAE